MPHRRPWFGSIGIRLGVLLSILCGVFVLSCGTLIAYQLSNIAETARSLRLHEQVEEIRHGLQGDENGVSRVSLPPERMIRYQGDDPPSFYALRDGAGAIVTTSSPALSARFGLEFLQRLEPGENEKAVGAQASERFHFLSETIEAPGDAGLTLIVAQRTQAIDALLGAVEWRLLTDTGFVAIPVLAALFGASLALIHLGFAPLRQLSRQIDRLGANNLGHRIDQASLPKELRGLAETASAAAQRLEQVIASQHRFTADTAHQLLTPLAVLSARIEQAGGAVGEIDLRGDIVRMEKLVRQLLQFSRLASMPARHDPIDLRDVARSVAIDLAPLAIAEGKNLSYEGPAFPCMTAGNANAIAEALGNVIRNGLRHTAPSTCVEIVVREPAVIDVADKGDGLPITGRERLLEPFFTTQVDKGGTGLGLAIANEVMRRHGGAVEMKNRAGGGALFRLRFEAVPTCWPNGA